MKHPLAIRNVLLAAVLAWSSCELSCIQETDVRVDVTISPEGRVDVNFVTEIEESCWRMSSFALAALAAALAEDDEPPYTPPSQDLPTRMTQLHFAPFDLSNPVIHQEDVVAESGGGVAHPLTRARDRIRSGDPAPETAPPALVYFTNKPGNEVVAFDRRADEVVDRVQVAGEPLGLAVAPDGRFLYVASEARGVVSVIQTEPLEVVETIDLPNGAVPAGIALTPDGSALYVASAEASGRVFVIDVETRSVAATIRAGQRALNVAISPDGTLAYVTSRDDGRVHVIDVLTNTVITALSVRDAYAVAFHPYGKSVFVTSADTPGKVTMFDVGADRATAEWDVGDMPLGLAVGPIGEALYVSNRDSDFITVISLSSQEVVGTIEVGPGFGPLVRLPPAA